jgi:hypothetical protein
MCFYLQFVPSSSPDFLPLILTSSQQSSLLTTYIVSFVFYTLVPGQLQTVFLLYTMQLTTLVLAAGLTLAAASTSTSTSASASTSTSSAPIASYSACAAQPYDSSIYNPITFFASYSSKVLDANLPFSPVCSMPVSPPNKPK